MRCRYCGGPYADDARTCGGCGAPKTFIDSHILDAPATPDHWINDFGRATMRVAFIGGGLALLGLLLNLIGLGKLMAAVIGFYLSTIAPLLLVRASFKSAKGSFLTLVRNLFLAGCLWFGMMMGLLITMGIIFAK